MSENIEHYRNQIALARTEIKNLRQQLSALKHEHLKEIKLIKSALNDLRCANCSDSATTLTHHTDAEPTTSQSDNITFQPIGVIETQFKNKRAVPRQPSVLANARGTIVIDQKVFNNPEHALSGLEEFSHIWVIFHFHGVESRCSAAKVAPPRLGGARRGVLATRSPHRPCAIGLSLVRVHSIEGNKIHFLGVDMVSGTPVLDIKPYIPQYDSAQSVDLMSGVTRPRTEGVSEMADDVAVMTVDDERSISPRVTHPIRIDTTPLPRTPFEGEASGDHLNLLTPMSPSPDSPSSVDLLDGTFQQAPRRLDTERGAPDGQERFTPPQSAYINTVDGVRVAPWISDPPSQRYEVRFTEDSLQRLNDLISDRAETFKSNIESLLSEDPRSHYVRTRYPDHEYSCVLEDLSISCVFDDNSAVCTIMAVRSAEDMQQT